LRTGGAAVTYHITTSHGNGMDLPLFLVMMVPTTPLNRRFERLVLRSGHCQRAQNARFVPPLSRSNLDGFGRRRSPQPSGTNRRTNVRQQKKRSTGAPILLWRSCSAPLVFLRRNLWAPSTSWTFQPEHEMRVGRTRLTASLLSQLISSPLSDDSTDPPPRSPDRKKPDPPPLTHGRPGAERSFR